NKVAVPEGAAGTPPFWRDSVKDKKVFLSCTTDKFVLTINISGGRGCQIKKLAPEKRSDSVPFTLRRSLT
ncbi:hypothetical protein, partial [Bacteroides caecigallinarum]|uniref:hypothetical protein n=1 Tax=Bacteroides caecigallinarum TaxID=1411144 RepID=UPI00195E8856